MPNSSSSSGERIVVLGKFTDALYVSVRGKTKHEVIGALSARKNEVSPGEFSEEADDLEIGGLPDDPLRLRPRGRGKYEYVLENEACYVEVTPWANFLPDFPAMMIQFYSRSLYANDLDELERIAYVIAGSFLEPGFEVMVRRFDLAVDFQLEGFELPETADVVTRARYSKLEADGQKPNTITFGKGSGALQVQLYEKTEEIKKKGKAWMFDVWRESPAYKEEVAVWRLEFRYFRKRLRAHDIHTIADLRVGMGDLVRSVVGDENTNPWIRIAAPETRDRRQDRREAAPWWEDLKAAFLEGMPNTTNALPSEPNPGHELKHTETMLFAYFEKLQVLGGGEGLHPEETSLEEFGALVAHRYSEHLAAKRISRSHALERRKKKMGLR